MQNILKPAYFAKTIVLKDVFLVFVAFFGCVVVLVYSCFLFFVLFFCLCLGVFPKKNSCFFTVLFCFNMLMCLFVFVCAFVPFQCVFSCVCFICWLRLCFLWGFVIGVDFHCWFLCFLVLWFLLASKILHSKSMGNGVQEDMEAVFADLFACQPTLIHTLP